MIVSNASYLHGITIVLYEQTETGLDDFNRPVLEETAVDVKNVLVGNPTEEEITETLNLTGRKVIYILGIPKGDEHDWTDKTVEFFGQKFRTIGSPIQGIESMIPLEWNRKVKCEAVNGEG